MTASENIVSRWARLKGEAASARRAEPAAEGPQAATAVGPETSSDSVQHGNEAAADETFDPASLPPIEAIRADTDIGAFLHSRVPADLTRLALRRAWASDPAIRDFIGIAESQWDFNDPDAMPGFGPLRASDDLPSLLHKALGNGDKLEQKLAASLPASREQAQSLVPDREPVNPDRILGQSSNAPATGADLGELAAGDRGEEPAARTDCIVEAGRDRPNQRSHGSALPRFKM
jgi:hypothetical protein